MSYLDKYQEMERNANFYRILVLDRDYLIKLGGSGLGADGRSSEGPEGQTGLSGGPAGFAGAGFHQRAAGLIL